MRRVYNQDRSAHGFSWCVHRASGRSPVRTPPFSAAGGTMRLDRGGVDRQNHAVLAAISQGFEDGPPAPPFGPAIEAIIDGRIGTILGRAITPAGATLEHMDDAADDPPIIISSGPVRFVGRCGSMHAHCFSSSQNNPARIESLPCRIAQHKRIRTR